jgi:hypothetical protein
VAAEPLGLLRFANLELHQLLRGLENRFDGLGDPAGMDVLLSNGTRREWVIRDRDLSLVFHTFLHEEDIDQSELMEKQAARLKLLRRKLLEELEFGDKIFVCKRNTPISEQEILPLHAALNRFGRNTLLWVTPGDEQHPPGGVDRILPGLLRGYIDRFAPGENAHDFSLGPWLSICINAAELRS